MSSASLGGDDSEGTGTLFLTICVLGYDISDMAILIAQSSLSSESAMTCTT